MASAIEQATAVKSSLKSDIKIGVYANNFTPIEPDHEANASLIEIRELTPEDYLHFAKNWFDLGADIIGGCCGIGPEHIASISKWKMQE